MRTRLIAATILAVLTISRGASAQNLLTNGSFESGSLAGWTKTGNFGLEGTDCPLTPVPDGECEAYFGTFASVSGISQIIPTVIGDSQTFSFWTKFDGNVQSSFAAAIGATNVFAITNPAASEYTQHSYLYTATGAATTVALDFRDDAGFIFLDDVRVVATTVTPEPSTYAMMAAGLFAVGFTTRRRRVR